MGYSVKASEHKVTGSNPSSLGIFYYLKLYIRIFLLLLLLLLLLIAFYFGEHQI